MEESNSTRSNEEERKVKAHLSLGQAKLANRQFQLAIEHYCKAWEISKQLEDKEHEISALFSLGCVYMMDEQAQTAIEYLHKSWEIANEQGCKYKETMILQRLGDACISNHQYPMAIKYLEKALEIFKELKFGNEEAKALLGLGKAYELNNQPQKAIHYCEKALNNAKELENKPEEITTLFQLASTYLSERQFQEAIRYYQEALRIAEEQEDKDHESMARNAIEGMQLIIDLDTESDTHQTLPTTSDAAQLQDTQHENVHSVDEIDETRNSAEQSLIDTDSSDAVPVQDTQDESVGNVDHVDIENESTREEPRVFAEQLSVLGSSFQNEDANDGRSSANADVTQEQSPVAGVKKVSKQGKDQRAREAVAHLYQGDAKFSNNQLQLAIEHYGKAWEILKQLEYKELEITALFSLGGAYLANKQAQMAIEYLHKSCEIAKEHGSKYEETKILLLLGDAYMSNYQYPTAIKYVEKALKIAEELKVKNEEAKALFQLGQAYGSNNQVQKAIGYCEKALNIEKELENKPEQIKTLFQLGSIYRSECQFREAIRYYQKALRIAEEQEYKDHENTARDAIEELSLTIDLDTEKDTHQTLPNTSHLAELQDTRNENVHNVDQKDEARNSVEQLLIGTTSSDSIRVQNTQHESFGNVVHVHIENEGINKETGIFAEQLSVLDEDASESSSVNADVIQKQSPVPASLQTLLQSQDDEESFKVPNVKKRERDLETHYDTHQMLPNASDVAQLQDTQHENDQKSSELWRWEGSSFTHRKKFLRLLEYRKIHPEEIQVVKGVRFCCSQEFLIGKGSDGTRVYVGLAEDGYERAVKCMRKDACAGLAEQEKKALNESSAEKSNHVVRYWFLDDTSDKHYLFLILDLCEETLEKFIADSDLKDLVTIAPDIIRQILKGLVDLHREPLSILHRDLKPSNILRNVDGDWLLADFGISRILPEGASTHPSKQNGTEDWRAVESSYTLTGIIDNGTVRHKKKSDIQVAGIVAFYIVTKGEHPFGEKRYRLDNLLEGKPVGLNTLKDPVAKDLIFWMLSHDPKDRPSAEEALKHPYLQSKKQQFEMLCKVGNQQEIKTGDINSPVVQNLNNDPTNWQTQMRPDVLNYLCIDFTNKRPKGFCYKLSWTDCLRLIRNVNQHWHDQPRPLPQPEAFYVVGDPQEYFLTRFPNLPVVVHGIVRSCDWRERPDLKEYFI